MAAEIIKALDREQLTVRAAHSRTSIAAADFSRIRNADLGGSRSIVSCRSSTARRASRCNRLQWSNVATSPPRIVQVMGATVTADKQAIALCIVSATTGRSLSRRGNWYNREHFAKRSQ
jgi:hypothetical protein